MPTKRCVMVFIAGVVLGALIVLSVRLLPPVHATIASGISPPDEARRTEAQQRPGGEEAAAPECNLEAGYCPRSRN
jgi:hypothetical protein